MNLKRIVLTTISLLFLGFAAHSQDSTVYKIIPAQRTGGDEFGTSLVLQNDILAVGASNYDGGINNAGGVFIFSRKSPGQWAFQQNLQPSGSSVGDGFGISIDMDNGQLVIGTLGDNLDADGNSPMEDAGSAYIYELGASEWTETAKLTPSDRMEDDRFGLEVAMQEDRVLVGARRQDLDPNGSSPIPNAGAVYSFEKTSDGGWLQLQKLVSPNRQDSSFFGWSIDIKGDLAIVGAPGESVSYNNQEVTQAGKAYIFRQDLAQNWVLESEIKAGDPETLDYFGREVLITSTHAFVAAPFKDVQDSLGNTLADAGAVYVYEYQGNGFWQQTQKLIGYASSYQESFGENMSLHQEYLLVSGHRKRKVNPVGDTLYRMGTAYVFEKNASNGFDILAELRTPDHREFDQLGYDVTIDRGTAIISAINQDFGLGANSDSIESAGAVYVFNESTFDYFRVDGAGGNQGGETGIRNQTSALTISVFPNPANGQVTIKSPDALLEEIRVFDLTGRLIYEDKLRSHETFINLEQKGVLLLEAKTENGMGRYRILSQ